MDLNLTYIAIVIVVILISMTLHEAMHAYVSYWLGDNTAKNEGRLTLNPIKHIDPFMTILLPVMLAIIGAPVFGGAKPVPINPGSLKWNEWGMALVALAGPMTNFLIAFIISGICVLISTPTQGIWGQVFITAISVNLGFFIFNMIPIPPLDGSRLLYALAPEFARRLMETMERFGVMIVFILIFIAGSAFGTFLVTAIEFFMQLFLKLFGL